MAGRVPSGYLAMLAQMPEMQAGENLAKGMKKKNDAGDAAGGAVGGAVGSAAGSAAGAPGQYGQRTGASFGNIRSLADLYSMMGRGAMYG